MTTHPHSQGYLKASIKIANRQDFNLDLAHRVTDPAVSLCVFLPSI